MAPSSGDAIFPACCVLMSQFDCEQFSWITCTLRAVMCASKNVINHRGQSQNKHLMCHTLLHAVHWCLNLTGNNSQCKWCRHLHRVLHYGSIHLIHHVYIMHSHVRFQDYDKPQRSVPNNPSLNGLCRMHLFGPNSDSDHAIKDAVWDVTFHRTWKW